MFNGIRQNNLIYALDKSNLRLRIGEVINVSNPTPKYGNTTFPTQPFAQPEMLIEIKVKFEDEEVVFKDLPANATITSKNNIVVSDSKDAMNSEIESMMRNSTNVLESVSYHQKVLESCDMMLRELNPQFAKEKQQEEKIGALEVRMENIDDKLNKMFELLSDTVKHGKNKKEE